MRSVWVLWIPLLVSCATGGAPRDLARRPAAEVGRRSTPLPLGISIQRTPQGDGITRDGKPLTPLFAAIESADVSTDRGEVVFAARRTTNFDIGLVSTDGSDVHWVPEDSADEVAPRWAPRGNKASYIVRNAAGDFVRTVHIPTAVALTVDFALAVVNDVRWDLRGEEFAVTFETPDASMRTETLTYAGERRRLSRPPETRLDVTVDPFGSGAILLRPRAVAYDEKLPLIVWIADARRNNWDPDRGRLLQNVRAACIVAERVNADFWAAVRQTSWFDLSRVFVVNPTNNQQPTTNNAVVITGDPRIRAGRTRRSGSSIRTHPTVVKSFAADFIAEQLKGIPPIGHR